jgi:hypothetical protein
LLEEKINEKNFNNYLKYPLKIKKKFRRWIKAMKNRKQI